MDGKEAVPSELLPHIYTYLLQNNFHKAAKLLQKNCGKSLAEQNGAGLLQFYTYYQKRHAGKRTVLTCPLETAEEGSPPSKRRKVKSVRENGGDDAKCKSAEVMKKKKKKKKGYLKAMAPGKAVLSNGHADDQCISISVPASPTGDKDMVASQTEHVVEAKKSPHISHQTLLHLTSDSSSLDSEKSAPSELPETTARTINEVGTDWLSHQNNATPNLLPLAPNPPASLPVADNRKRVRSSTTGTASFRRVADDTTVDPRLQDNSFEAKVGSRGSWGEKANKDLKFTKGKSFRHQKTKKKRGTYKGGSIDMSVCSFKFDSD